MSLELGNSTNNRSLSRTVFLSAGLFLSMALTSAGCKSGYPVSARNNPGTEAKEPRQVKIARVSEIAMEQMVTVTGTVASEVSLDVNVTTKFVA